MLGPKSSQHFLRPTCDRVREALFNILGDKVQEAVALDLFAGTGAWGLEALSRGASTVLFVDESAEAGRLIAANIKNCMAAMPEAQAAFIRLRLNASSQLAFLGSRIATPHRFDLVFLDPPYQKNLAKDLLKVVEEAHILAPGALVVAEEHHSAVLPEHIGSLHCMDKRQYGESSLWFFTQNGQPTGT